MSTIRSIARRLTGVTLAAVTAVALAACDSDQVGAAAVVGGERITVDEVQEQAQRLIDTPGSGLDDTHDYGRLQRDLLSREILARIMRRVAENEDIEVTDAQVDDLVDQQFQGLPPDQDIDALLAEGTYTRESFREAARSQLVANQLIGSDGDQTALREALDTATAELEIEVSPRFGEWSESFVVEEVSGSISTPAGDEDEATPPDTAPVP